MIKNMGLNTALVEGKRNVSGSNYTQMTWKNLAREAKKDFARYKRLEMPKDIKR